MCTHTHTCPPTWETKQRTNDNLRDDLIEIARTLVAAAVALKLSSIKFNFSFASYMHIMQPTTLVFGLWLRFLVWFGSVWFHVKKCIISNLHISSFRFAISILCNIFFRLFHASRIISKQQQHPITPYTQQITYHSVHGIELNDFWTLPNKHVAYMVHTDTDACKYTHTHICTQALSKLARVPDERNHGN